jgi:hypothetical protein
MDNQTFTFIRENIFYYPITFHNQACEDMMKFLFCNKLSADWSYDDGIYPNWSFKTRPYIRTIRFKLDGVDTIIYPLKKESWDQLNFDHLETLDFFLSRRSKNETNYVSITCEIGKFLNMVDHGSLIDFKYLESQGLQLQLNINPYGGEIIFEINSASFKLSDNNNNIIFDFTNKYGYQVKSNEGEYIFSNKPIFGTFIDENGNLRYSSSGFHPIDDKGKRVATFGRFLTNIDNQNIEKYQKELKQLYHKGVIKQQCDRLLLIAYYKNQDNQYCLISKLPRDIIRTIINLL